MGTLGGASGTPGRAALTADLYLEPSHESNPSLHVTIHYGDGTTAEFDVAGGPADVNLRMPSAALAARWVGQDGQDWTGPTPAVGPDGRQDVHLALSQLSAHIAVKSLTVSSSGPVAWQYGLNPERDWNAELVPHDGDSSQADLFFSPNRDLSGQALTLKAVYANDKTDHATVTAGACDPARPMPIPAVPVLRPNPNHRPLARSGAGGRRGWGNVRVALASLPPGRPITSAALSDPVAATGPSPALPDAQPLTFTPSSDGRHADLSFPPFRDESDATLTLRLTFADGTMTLVQFPGGRCDRSGAGRLPAPASALAHPGDDLQALAARGGTLTLAPGTYPLHRPLDAGRADHAPGDAGGDRPVFAAGRRGPLGHGRRNPPQSYDPDRLRGPFRRPDPLGRERQPRPSLAASRAGQGMGDPRMDVEIARMDLEGPPVPGPVPPGKLLPSPFLMFLEDARSGRVAGNRLRGGTTDVIGGPWQITDNTYEGAMPGTMEWDTFAGHYLHDLLVARNVLSPPARCGQDLALSRPDPVGDARPRCGQHVRGVGIRDGDGVPNPNTPELFLTEAYRLHYEGQARWISSGGRILQIPRSWTGRCGPARSARS